jgi:hypothetical protein
MKLYNNLILRIFIIIVGNFTIIVGTTMVGNFATTIGNYATFICKLTTKTNFTTMVSGYPPADSYRY